VGGFKKSVVSKKEHDKIATMLNDPNNEISGYTELLEWVNKELCKHIKYITLVKYTEPHFGNKIKEAKKI
jgi:hypothetical protein